MLEMHRLWRSLEAAYDALDSRMIADYNPTISDLSGVSFYDAVHQPASYLNQDVAYDPNSYTFNAQSVPEPAGIVSATIALGSVFLVWSRRMRKPA